MYSVSMDTDKKISIALVEDNSAIRNRLSHLFHFAPKIELLFAAPSAEDCLEWLKNADKSNLPRVIFMDIELPGINGIEATSQIKALYPEIEIIIQTVFEDDEKIFEAVKAGASGYLLKDEKLNNYLAAIDDILSGGVPFSANIARKMLQFVKNPFVQKSNKQTENEFDLTQREKEILTCVVDELSENEISTKLFISNHTVKTHLKNIYKKLEVHSRSSAVKKAIINKLV